MLSILNLRINMQSNMYDTLHQGFSNFYMMHPPPEIKFNFHSPPPINKLNIELQDISLIHFA